MRIHAESVSAGTSRSQAMLALFLFSASTLTFEVALTRVCNGVASILGSALVVALVLEVGFQMATFLPAAAYVVAGIVITRFRA